MFSSDLLSRDDSCWDLGLLCFVKFKTVCWVRRGRREFLFASYTNYLLVIDVEMNSVIDNTGCHQKTKIS